MARDERIKDAESKVLIAARGVAENLQEFWEALGEYHELTGLLEKVAESVDELDWVSEKVKDERGQ